MKVLVDTTVWSLALRRRPEHLAKDQAGLRKVLCDLIADDRVMMIGPVRQELLSGVRDSTVYEQLHERLSDFDDELLVTEDFETAAQVHNACRTAGISGSAIDFLICAVALRRDITIFTTDQDFVRYASVVRIRLYEPDIHETSSAG